MQTIFFDANVIADWLLIATRLKEDKEGILLKEIKQRRNQAYTSYKIFNLIEKTKIKKFRFYTSELAVAEVGDVIFKEISSQDLLKKTIPFRYVQTQIRSNVLNPEQIENISRIVKLFNSSFISKSKIKIYNKIKYPEFPSYLISLFRIETYDAYLLSQAFDLKCEYFVTNDKPLRDEVGEIKLDTSYELKLISPEELEKQMRITESDWDKMVKQTNFFTT